MIEARKFVHPLLESITNMGKSKYEIEKCLINARDKNNTDVNGIASSR